MIEIPNNAIERAIEGGWGNGKFEGYFVDETQKPSYKNGVVLSCENPMGNTFVGYELNVNDIALDPSFWQCLGKALGWNIEADHFPENRDGMLCATIYGVEWKFRARRFYDLILTSGNTDAYWNELLGV